MPPEVSVVVPTHSRPAGLARLLAALREQTLAGERFEVVVVDDGSDPPAQAGDGARVVRHERARGPAAARNAGWREAGAPLVAFVDDDCVPAPGWLDAILAAGDGDAAVVQGPVEHRGEVTPLDHTIEVAGPSRLCVSANIAYARALLERTGGFDETLRRAGEDVELGTRALAAGGELRWAPEARVEHEVRRLGLAGRVRQTLAWTESVRVVGMHPELRDLLTARVFWRPSHPLLLLALAAAATRRPLVALVGAAPYVRHRRGRWLPVHAVVDAVEIAAAAAASVRYRTLML
jgi:cellulose synthase/poly-beta-1,6-N-acetylglucosamine synthase-like glycosyltransferase